MFRRPIMLLLSVAIPCLLYTSCYAEEERQKAVGRCGANAEITRFKGLGEISPDEFREFIGENIFFSIFFCLYFVSGNTFIQHA